MEDVHEETADFSQLFIFERFVTGYYHFFVAIGIIGMASVGLSLLGDQLVSVGISGLVLEILIAAGVLLVISVSAWMYIEYVSLYVSEAAVLSALINRRGILVLGLLTAFNLITLVSVTIPMSETQMLYTIFSQGLFMFPFLAYGIASRFFSG